MISHGSFDQVVTENGHLVQQPSPRSGAGLTPPELPVPSEKLNCHVIPKPTLQGKQSRVIEQETGEEAKLLLSRSGPHGPTPDPQQKMPVGCMGNTRTRRGSRDRPPTSPPARDSLVSVSTVAKGGQHVRKRGPGWRLPLEG